MFYSVELIKEIESLDPKMRDILFKLMSEIEQRYSVSKDIEELKEIVKQISIKVDTWIENSKEEYRKLWELNQQNAERIAQLIKTQEKHSKEIEELKESVKQLVKTQEQHSKEIAELRETVKQLIKTQELHSKEIAELREIVKQNSKDIAELKETVKQLIKTQELHSKEIAELREIVKQNSKDIAELKETVKQLIKTQEQHSKEIAELREIVKQNSKDIAGLIEEHKQTRAKLDKLIEDHEETRSQLGGLSHTVGYFLEDKSYIHLPPLLKKEFNIDVVGELYRDYIEIGKNKYVEVNILGKAVKDGKEIYIIGEAKTQAKKKDIDAVVEMAKKIEKVIPQEKFLVLVTYQASPQVREYAKEKGVKIYFSYQLR